MPMPSEPGAVPAAVVRELAPSGVLRAAINLGNFLLVTGRTPGGEPTGVAPDMARAVAASLGVPVRYVTYERPAALADAATSGAWDIGLIGAEPQRAENIAFTAAYVEIEATYLVAPGSALRTPAEVDRPGVRIAVADRTAYGLWLDRHIEHAELVRTAGLDSAFDRFVDDGLEALAGLRPRLLVDARRLPGSRVMEGRFTAVQQAIGTPIGNVRAAEYLSGFVERAKASGMVAELIARHGVQGLTVAQSR